jgi:hypothetical protein
VPPYNDLLYIPPDCDGVWKTANNAYELVFNAKFFEFASPIKYCEFELVNAIVDLLFRLLDLNVGFFVEAEGDVNTYAFVDLSVQVLIVELFVGAGLILLLSFASIHKQQPAMLNGVKTTIELNNVEISTPPTLIKPLEGAGVEPTEYTENMVAMSSPFASLNPVIIFVVPP